MHEAAINFNLRFECMFAYHLATCDLINNLARCALVKQL